MKNSSRFRHLFTLAALMISIIGLPTPTPTIDHAMPRPNAATQSLSNLLNPDGTLNLRSGFNGSFDAHGWRMTTTADGEPRFVAAAMSQVGVPHKPTISGDEWWDSEFQTGVSYPGYAAYVYAIAVHGSDVYIGGTFQRAGGIAANSIVRYNTATQHWYPLGTGIDSGVYSILVNGNSVYVGGNFNDAGGQSVGGVARWDTISQSWSGVGAYLTSSNGQFAGVVNALALDGSGRLIVGGYFDHAGTLPVNNIARWDGANWSAIGSGIGGTNIGTDEVYALAVSGSDIYAGGFFTNPTSNLAHWNGSTWLSDTGGTNGIVRALLFNGSTLYVGGDFTQVGALTDANRIAAWDGTNWSTLGAGTNNTVRSIALGSDGLYIGGLFTMVNGSSPVSYIAIWAGSGWAVPGSNLDGEVDALAINGGDVYMGGNFMVTDGGLANHLARWSVPSSSWYSIGNSPNGEIFAVAINGSDVYVGGQFNSVGGIAAHNIAKWNSSTGAWSALGYGVAGCTGVPGCVGAVYAIAINGTDVYAGGTFTLEGEDSSVLYPTGPVARWDTILKRWWRSYIADPYSAGSQLSVYALAPEYDGVVVGGSFLHAPCGPVGNQQTCAVNNVVYWSGGLTYSPFTDGVITGTNSEVHALLNDGYGMYLGGDFTSPRQKLVYFDGYDWFGLGSSLNGTVYALAADSQYLYAGGYFSNAGGSGANRIARLPFVVGGDWQPMGSGLDGAVTGLAWNGNDLIAVGRFNQSGLLGLNNIARWNTTTGAWSALGSGTGGIPFNQNWSVAATNQEIYVGGYFVNAGGKESDYLARWAHFQTYLPSLIK